MLKKLAVSAFFLFAVGMVSAQASAAFVATDWQSAGDEGATLDTTTGIEWLDLTVTKGKSYAEVSALLSTTLKGWRFPTTSETHAMMSSFFPSIAPLGYDESITLQTGDFNQISGDFLSLFGANSYYDETFRSSILMHKSEDNVYARSVISLRNGVDDDILRYRNVYSGDDNSFLNVGSYFLVSDGGATLSSIKNPALNINNPKSPINEVPDQPADVPVNTGFGMLLMSMIAFGMRRRKSA